MTTPRAAAFTAAYLGTAVEVSAAIGLDPSVLLAQWACETAFGAAFSGSSNLGNIRCSPTSFCAYASLDDFAAAAIVVFRNGLYPGVLAAAGQPVAAQITALGASPWAAGHYGSPPGSGLLPFLEELNLPTLDDIQNNVTRQGNFLSDRLATISAAVLAAIKAVPASTAGGLTPAQAQELQEAHDAAQQAVAELKAGLHA